MKKVFASPYVLGFGLVALVVVLVIVLSSFHAEFRVDGYVMR